MSEHDAIAALRGCSWNGHHALTFRVYHGAAEAAADAQTLTLPEDPGSVDAIAREYASFITATGHHPAAVRLGTSVLQVGPDADNLGTAVDTATWAAAPSTRNDVVRNAVALITGGAQGFGLEIARGLLTAGAQVILADMNIDGAQTQADALNIEFGGQRCSAVAVNVTDEESVAGMVAQAVQLYGGLDLVISNAGVLKAGSVRELTLKDFQFVTSVNYTGFFLVTKHCAPVLATQNAAAKAMGAPAWSGDIIEINSKSGLAGSNKNGAYAGSKFGGIGLVQSFAMELIEDNIKVNAICPGNFLDGPLWSDPDRGLFVQYLRAGKVPGAQTIQDVRRSYEERVPMKRGCTGEDVVRAILYVVEQRYETGQAVPVTGGQEMLR